MKLSFGIILIILAIFAFTGALAKIFDKCTLAKELVRLGIPKSELPDWVCIAQYESSFNTKAVGRPNSNGSRDWGLFQINDIYWCQSKGRSYNMCKMSCNDLLTDSIAKSVQCARLIKKQQGLSAWVAWNNNCQRNKPNTNVCF